MTIEPTAIRLGLPVDTKFTFDQIAALQSELCEPSYQRAVIFIAWEHVMAADLVKHLVTSFGGDPQAVPDWPKDDYDSIYIVRLRTDPQGKRSVSFEHDHEGLDGLSTRYPEVNRESAIKN